jgi:hypothetical protein
LSERIALTRAAFSAVSSISAFNPWILTTIPTRSTQMLSRNSKIASMPPTLGAMPLTVCFFNSKIRNLLETEIYPHISDAC